MSAEKKAAWSRPVLSPILIKKYRKLAEEKDAKIVKFSRRVFKELSHSIIAVKRGGKVHLHAQLHAASKPKATRPSYGAFIFNSKKELEMKGFIAQGADSRVFWLPSIDGGKDRVRAVPPEVVDSRYAKSCAQGILNVIESFDLDRTAWIGLDGLVVRDGYYTQISTYFQYHLCDLMSRRESLTTGQKIEVLKQLARALSELHEKKIGHGDLHNANVMFAVDSESAIGLSVRLIDLETANESVIEKDLEALRGHVRSMLGDDSKFESCKSAKEYHDVLAKMQEGQSITPIKMEDSLLDKLSTWWDNLWK